MTEEQQAVPKKRSMLNATARILLAEGADQGVMSARGVLEFAAAILAGQTAHEREQRTRRMQEGLEAKRNAAGDNWRTGMVPYGWKSVGHGRLMAVNGPQVVIEWIHRQRDQGYGWDNITQRLNEAGTPAPMGGKWHMATVRRIVRRGRGWQPPGVVVDPGS